MPDGDPIIIGQANTASNPGNIPGKETSLSRNENTAETVFVARNLNVGDAIHGEASGSSTGVYGESNGGYGVQGRSNSGPGVTAISNSGFGMYASTSSGSIGVLASSPSGDGVWGSSSTRIGVRGTSTSGDGVDGFTTSGAGVRGASTSGTGMSGTSGPAGVGGTNFSAGFGVSGTSRSGNGVDGTTIAGNGVNGTSTSGFGVNGTSTRGLAGVNGFSSTRIGVRGASTSGTGVRGSSGFSTSSVGVLGIGLTGGFFVGNLVVAGLKLFKMDHPLDPENKYLSHACVESSEMKNVYDGVARLDEDGAAWVELPEWFETLNGDFRYQLTAVGGSAPNLHVAEEISENRFKIAGGEEGMKVCWQVTGTRKDRWAAANPFEVEQEKGEEERGRYLHPGLYGAPEEQRVMIGQPIAGAVEEEQPSPEPSGIDFARLEEERLRQMMMQHPPHPHLRNSHRRRSHR